jgi:signal transduction histidine kinase
MQQHAVTQTIAASPVDARRDLLRTSHFVLAGELVGAVMHDLRQPVTAMTVNVEVAMELLQRRPSDLKGALAALEDALDGGRQLGTSLRVVHNLIAHRSPMRATVAMEEVLAETMRLVQTEANTRRVEIAVIAANGLPALQADPAMLRQAVLNLVLDAVENATPADGVHVRLAVTDAGAVELTVCHVRRDDPPDDGGWELAVARRVAEAHGVALQIDRGSEGQVVVRTEWPAAPATRFDLRVM